MKSDTEIREAVMEALSKSPNIAAENIGVSIVDGVVTLGGYVQDLLEKVDAEKCAWGGLRGPYPASKMSRRTLFCTDECLDEPQR